jgi:hypothetical protein
MVQVLPHAIQISKVRNVSVERHGSHFASWHSLKRQESLQRKKRWNAIRIRIECLFAIFPSTYGYQYLEYPVAFVMGLTALPSLIYAHQCSAHKYLI